MGAFFDRLTAFGQPLTIVAVLMRIGVAVVIGAVIGIEREIKNRPAGMRTHVLVCVGAALVSLIESQTVADVVALGNASIGVSMGRITTSVVSGVGFLGAGHDFHERPKDIRSDDGGVALVHGLHRFGGGFGLYPDGGRCWRDCAGDSAAHAAHCACQHAQAAGGAVIHRTQTLAFLNEYFMNLGVKILDVDFHAESRPEGNLYTNLYTLSMPAKTSYVDVIGTLSEHPNIRTVRTEEYLSSHPSAVCGRLSPPQGEEDRVNGERGKTFRVSSHEKTSEITSLTLWHASSPQRPKTRGRSVSRGRRKSPCRLVATSAARTVCPSDWVSMVIKMTVLCAKKTALCRRRARPATSAVCAS